MDHKEKLNLLARLSNHFRPGAPIDRYALFAGRQNQVNDVIQAILQPGQHVILFGERGVGKTSLAKVISEVLQGAGFKLLDSGTINCDGTDDFSSLWHKIFRELAVVLETRKAGFQPNTDEGKLSLEALLPEQARPDDVRYALNHLPKESDSIIIIDEVDRITDANTRTLLADTIKNLSDHSVPTTIILVGVADSVSELIAEHRSVERCLTQVPMPRMSVSELTQIIDTGFSAVGMTMGEDAKNWITQLSQGLPHYTHSLALYSARIAVNNDSLNVTMAEVNAATTSTVEKMHTLLSKYNLAAGSPQQQNIYGKVLLACALAEKDELGYFRAAALVRPMTVLMGKPYGVPNFSRHLNSFCEARRASILQKTGTARLFRYRFAEALMTPYVMIHGYSTGIITDQTLLKIRGKAKCGPDGATSSP